MGENGISGNPEIGISGIAITRQHLGTASEGENRTATASEGVAHRNPDETASGIGIDVKTYDNIVNVDEDVVKSQPQNHSDKDTSDQLGSLPASTQYFLEPGFYTQNFCCVVDPQVGGSKIIFMRNV